MYTFTLISENEMKTSECYKPFLILTQTFPGFFLFKKKKKKKLIACTVLSHPHPLFMALFFYGRSMYSWYP